MSEEVLGIIDDVKGGRPARHWSLFVTTDRIIAATVGKAGLGSAFEFGGVLMAKSRARRRTEKLRDAAPDDVLRAHRKNFDIPYSHLAKAELDDPDVVASGTLILTTDAGTHEFTLTDKDNYPRHAEILKSALEEKLALV